MINQVCKDTVWQLDVVERLASLLYDGKLNRRDVADILSEEFGVRITKGAVIGYCNRSGVKKAPVYSKKRRPRRPPLTRPVVLPPSKRGAYRLTDLNVSMCKWPTGDRPPYLYCGEPADVLSYCKKHAAVAFRPVGKAL